MTRRDAILATLTALLLALFPWLRTETGARIVRRGLARVYRWADVTVYINGVPLRGVGSLNFEGAR